MPDKPVEQMTSDEVNREIAERLEPNQRGPNWKQNTAALYTQVDPYDGGTWIPRPFTSDHNACHDAWMRLTEEQKYKLMTHIWFLLDEPHKIFTVPIYIEDATAEQKARWILAAVRSGK